jgi:hypothetical protein
MILAAGSAKAHQLFAVQSLFVATVAFVDICKNRFPGANHFWIIFLTWLISARKISHGILTIRSTSHGTAYRISHTRKTRYENQNAMKKRLSFMIILPLLHLQARRKYIQQPRPAASYESQRRCQNIPKA